MNKYLNMNAFRKDVEAALKDIEKKYKVTVKAGKITYDDLSMKLQLQVDRADVDVQKENFKENVRWMSGLTEDDYLAQVTIDGKNYTITGLKPGNKYSVVLEREDGKSYAFTHSTVMQALKRSA